MYPLSHTHTPSVGEKCRFAPTHSQDVAFSFDPIVLLPHVLQALRPEYHNNYNSLSKCLAILLTFHFTVGVF